MTPERSCIRPLHVEHVLKLRDGGAHILDTRDPAAFARAHLRGALNIGMDELRASCWGSDWPLDQVMPIVIIGDPGTEPEAATCLGRIGFDNVLGYLEAGMPVLAAHPDQLETRPEGWPNSAVSWN
jgi:rhodanese-related sulfurtransferase